MNVKSLKLYSFVFQILHVCSTTQTPNPSNGQNEIAIDKSGEQRDDEAKLEFNKNEIQSKQNSFFSIINGILADLGNYKMQYMKRSVLNENISCCRSLETINTILIKDLKIYNETYAFLQMKENDENYNKVFFTITQQVLPNLSNLTLENYHQPSVIMSDELDRCKNLIKCKYEITEHVRKFTETKIKLEALEYQINHTPSHHYTKLHESYIKNFNELTRIENDVKSKLAEFVDLLRLQHNFYDKSTYTNFDPDAH